MLVTAGQSPGFSLKRFTRTQPRFDSFLLGGWRLEVGATVRAAGDVWRSANPTLLRELRLPRTASSHYMFGHEAEEPSVIFISTLSPVRRQAAESPLLGLTKSSPARAGSGSAIASKVRESGR